MKTGSKIIHAEYKAKLRKITSTYPSQSIRFGQFMELLARNDLRIYSKAQIGKLFKIFDNPLKLCRIQVPLSYLQLDCVQQSEKKRYFVVKVSSHVINSGLYQIKNKDHSTVRCLGTLIKILKSLYGSQRNWFKVLGGLTVAVTIDKATFKKSISKVLCNTSHAGCVEELANFFVKESHGKEIQWKGFMNVINDYQKMQAPMVQSNFQFLKSSLMSRQSNSKTFYTHQRRASLDTCEKRNVQSAYSRPSHMRKHSLRTQCSIQIQNNHFLSLQAKPCVLYEKKNKQPSFFNSFRSTSKSHSWTRKLKTQSNFREISRQRTSQLKCSTRSVGKSIQIDQQKKKNAQQNKIQDCVVVFQNESGTQVII